MSGKVCEKPLWCAVEHVLLGLEDERRLLNVDGANASPPIVSRDKTKKTRTPEESNKQDFNPIRGDTILSACGNDTCTS